jgi:hypothetical protein
MPFGRDFVVLAELALQDAVNSAGALLLTQLKAAVGNLAAACGALAGGIGPLLERAFRREAFLALEVQFVPEAAT